MTPFTLAWGARRLVLGARTRVMGVVNVTPDSFSDGGRFLKTETAIDQGLRLLDEGADILDIGGESTRPFSDPVVLDEELRRVLPVIEALARRDGALISIDTTKAEVARRALEAGAAIINDVSALRVDPAMGPLAAQYGVPVVLMHMLGTPKTMQVDPHYEDVVAEVGDFLHQAVDRAVAAGIDASLLMIDPGFGFGKTFDHNLQLLNGLHRLHALGLPLLVGTSRKAFIRHLLKPPGEADLPADLPLIASGTQATVAAAALKGAHIIRVHDVAETRATLQIIDAIRNAGGHSRQERQGDP